MHLSADAAELSSIAIAMPDTSPMTKARGVKNLLFIII
jgi:hypothetical protein